MRSWYLYDGLGSVLAEIGDLDTNYNVTLTAAPKTDVYGNPISTETGSNHRFCGGLGHKTDSDTGLIYMRARYYDPAIGRFASEDPARSGANWYAYCAANPVDHVDADGRMTGSVGEPVAVASISDAVEAVGSQTAATILRGKALELVLYIDARMAAMEAAFAGTYATARGQLVLQWTSSVTGKSTTFRFDTAGGHINIAGFARNSFGGHAVGFEKWLQMLYDTFGP